MKKLFNDLLIEHGSNIAIVAYLAEFGGSAVRRIITSHDEYYSEYDNPLAFPNHIEGFKRHLNHFLDFKEQHLACAHTNDVPIDIVLGGAKSDALGDDIDKNLILFHENQRILLDQGHKVCWRAHEDAPDEKFFEHTKIIKLYGNSLNRFKKAVRYKKKTNSYHDTDLVPPSNSKNICNVEASKLFSQDFDEFLNEYLKIVDHLDVSPKINSVRQFILLWLEKQERFKLTLS